MAGRYRGTAGLGLALTALLLASACGDDRPGGTATPQGERKTEGRIQFGTVTLTQSACTLEGLTGPIDAAGQEAAFGEFAVVNETDGLAFFDLGRIQKGHTFQELEAFVKKARRRAEEGRSVIHRPSYVGGGGIAEVGAGESGTMVATLPPGAYGLTCLREFPLVKEPYRPFVLIGPIEVVE